MSDASNPTPITVTFVDEKREIRTLPGANLRTLALNAGVSLYNVHFYDPFLPFVPGLPSTLLNCRGLGLCGSCLVEVIEGMENLDPPAHTIKEDGTFGNGPLAQMKTKRWNLDPDRSKYRLACQVKVMGDVKLRAVRDTVDFNFDR